MSAFAPLVGARAVAIDGRMSFTWPLSPDPPGVGARRAGDLATTWAGRLVMTAGTNARLAVWFGAFRYAESKRKPRACRGFTR
jgi:hypothetical protein